MMSSKHLGCATSLLVLLPLLLPAQRAQQTIPLKNWSTPQHWQASRVEKDAAAKIGTQQPQTTNTVSPDSLTFVAITPCRLVDTRGPEVVPPFNGVHPFSGPSILSGGTAMFPVQSANGNTEPAPCDPAPTT